MEKFVTLRGTRLRVIYSTTIGDTETVNTIQRVLLPGDNLEITARLSGNDRRRIQQSLDRAPRARDCRVCGGAGFLTADGSCTYCNGTGKTRG